MNIETFNKLISLFEDSKYNEIIKFSLESKQKYEINLELQGVIILKYLLLVWASYQHIWNLDIANKYYKKYLDSLNIFIRHCNKIYTKKAQFALLQNELYELNVSCKL